MDLGVFGDVSHHESAEADVLDEAGEDPALIWRGKRNGGLLEHDLASGIDVGDHAPAETDTAEDLAFHAGDVAGALIDPEAATEAGEGL